MDDEHAHDDHSGDEDDHHAHDHSHDDQHAHDDHHAHDADQLSAGVVTISSSRSMDDDPSGDAIVAAFEDAGHEIGTREIVADGFDNVQSVVSRLVGRSDVDVVVTTGGTGVTPDDETPDAVGQLLDKELPGFGELFRRLSYDEIGTRIVGTRAVAGVADGVPVFCLPGSENAVELGVEEIILPEVGHLAGLARRDETDEE